MKKLFLTLLAVFACGSAFAAELNVSGQYGVMTDKGYGDHMAGIQVAMDDIYKGVGIYGEYGKIRGGDVLAPYTHNKVYRGVGLTYKATDKFTPYIGIAEGRYLSERFLISKPGEKPVYSAHRKVETGVVVGTRYTVTDTFAVGLGYNDATEAVFGTVGYTFK